MLQSVVRNCVAGRIEPEQLLPARHTQTSGPPNSKINKPNLLILFVVGGVSLEEAAQLQEMKEIDVELLVGGTHLLDTQM